ncbi:MAG: glycoside hydrolase family 78 protein [Mangrovibacterium sp.]
MRLRSTFTRLIFSGIFLFTVLSGQAQIVPHGLTCEKQTEPVGIDVTQPRFSWLLPSQQRGVVQSAYRIVVASSPEKLAVNDGDWWDSGKVLSGQSANIVYDGKRLKSQAEAYWKVKVWQGDQESEWSEPARFSMGLLYYKDWSGRWIGFDRAFEWDREDKFARLSARYFRKEFQVSKEVQSANVYLFGLGLYELYFNGQKIGDQVLAPTPTDYTKNVKYNVFDVTEYLKAGDNAVGTILGNGRYYAMRQNEKPYKIKTFGYPKMLLQLEITYTDGTKDILKTDNSWKGTADGPIRTNNEYDGEEYDARKEMPGWNQPGFDDSAWIPAEYVQEPRGEFEAQLNPNMKVMHTLKPVSLKEVRPGVFILDLGQNMVGWLQMKVRGAEGDQVTLRFAEILDEQGELARANLRDAKATDVYTLKGDGDEVWEPSFVYHGFQFVEITGYPGKPSPEDFEGRVVYDDMATIGTFETSNALINQIYKNAWWGINGNYKGMPVDCPQRNERQPWLGDRSTGAYGESFVFDNALHYAKWLDDIRNAQRADGSIPDVAPAFWRYYSNNMTWAGTYLMVADMLHRQFGDAVSVAKHYPNMKRWLKFMEDRYMTDDFIMTKDSYGDWCVPPATIEEGRGKNANVKYPSQLISTAYHYYYLQLMQKFAVLTGNESDIPAFTEMASQVKAAFNREFYDAEKASYGTHTLTDNLLAYALDLVPESDRDRLFKTITDIIEVDNKGHLSTGLIGTQWLMRTLTENGRADLAYRLATNKTYPSWGYMVENGATTIWELWNGNTAAPNMNSYNHVMMLGDLIIWFYENLAGIKSSEEAPGFKKIIMKPEPVSGLDFVKASYETIHGTIKSHWQKKGKTFNWTIVVPANTTATVYLPASAEKDIRESGKALAAAPGVRFVKMEGDRGVLEVGSGEYHFQSK